MFRAELLLEFSDRCTDQFGALFGLTLRHQRATQFAAEQMHAVVVLAMQRLANLQGLSESLGRVRIAAIKCQPGPVSECLRQMRTAGFAGLLQGFNAAVQGSFGQFKVSAYRHRMAAQHPAIAAVDVVLRPWVHLQQGAFELRHGVVVLSRLQ